MESEGLYRYEHRDEQKAFVVVGPGRENMGGTYTKNEASIAARLANLAYAEGRKAAEKEIEEKKAVKDALLCGTGFMKDGKRVPPEDVYLSEAEIKLKEMEKDFKELLELADRMCDKMESEFYCVAREFYAWKKARGLE